MGWAGPSSFFDFELGLDVVSFGGSGTGVEDETALVAVDDLEDFYNSRNQRFSNRCIQLLVFTDFGVLFRFHCF